MLPEDPFSQSPQLTTLQPWRRLWVRTTTLADASNRYGWQEQRQTLAGDGTWEANTDGLSGTQTNGMPLYMIDGPTTAVGIGQLCEAVVYFPGNYLLGWPVTAADCVDEQLKVERERRCENGIDNLYARTLTYNCGALQFPLPAFILVGQVGCCACTGSGSGIITCCPPTASLYFCLPFPNAKCTIPSGCGTCQDPAQGVTLLRNGSACEWDNTHGGALVGLVECGSQTYQIVLYGCDSDDCGDATLSVIIYQYTSGVFTGKAAYLATQPSWNCNSPVVLAFNYNSMTGPDDLGVTVTQFLTIFPGPGPCGQSGSGSGSGSGPPYWCVEQVVQSGGGGVAVGCCPVPVPVQMTVALSGGTGACTCLNGKNVTVTNLGGLSSNIWQGSLAATCSTTVNVTVSCNPQIGVGFVFNISINGGLQTTASSVNCNPLDLVFNNVSPSGTVCAGTINAIATVAGGGGGGSGGSGAASYVCISQNQITGGDIAPGQPIEWGGGQTGTILSGPYADATCGGACPGSGSGIIIGGCCFPLPERLHVTFGGAFAGLGSLPFTSRTGANGPWYYDRFVTSCGVAFLKLSCDAMTGLWGLSGTFLSGAGDLVCTIQIVGTGAFTTSCNPLLVKFVANPGGGVPGQGTITYSNCAPGFCQGQMTAMVTP